MIYVFLAQGFEEIEGLTVVDVLRRAKLDVQMVGVGGKVVTGSHGITITCDVTTQEIQLSEDLQMVVLPGGLPGTTNLEQDQIVQKAIDYCVESGKYVCAICAAPSILGHKHLLDGKQAICFPGFEKELYGAVLSQDPVCVDGNIVTAKGMGVATEFSLQLVECLLGEETKNTLKASLQCRD